MPTLATFTVTGDIAVILGQASGLVTNTYQTTWRIVFSTNLEQSFVPYDGGLFSLEDRYAGLTSTGAMKTATMGVGNAAPTVGANNVVLAAGNLGFSGLQWHFKLEKPSGSVWIPVYDFWFDAPNSGTTVNLEDLAPAVGSSRHRGPAANIVSGLFDGNDDLVLTNQDQTNTTPIELPAGVIAFVDNGDGTVQVG